MGTETDTLKAVKKTGAPAWLIALVLALAGGGAAGSGVVSFGTGERLARIEERLENVQKAVERLEQRREPR